MERITWEYGITPKEIVDLMKDVIMDKSLCHVGCSDGSFMQHCRKYTSSVVGIEKNEYDAECARAKGLSVVTGNALIDDMPDADVYYLWWLGVGDTQKISERLTGKVRIFGCSDDRDLNDYIGKLNPEYRKIEYIRKSLSRLTMQHREDIRLIGMYTLSIVQ